jgi:predicted lipid carrier protein YhbT
MRRRRTRPYIAAREPGSNDSVLASAMIALRGPVEALLTLALRSLARRCPGAFGRLGGYQTSTYLLCPADMAVAFTLAPHPRHGVVRVVRRGAPGTYVARVSAPLADLLALFDGSLDADAAFFARSIQVEGDVGAVMALHNALESADLRLVDLLPLPAGHAAANAILAGLLRAARHRPTSSWA